MKNKKIVIPVTIIFALLMICFAFAAYIYCAKKSIAKISSLEEINNNLKEDFLSQIDAKNNEINTLKEEIQIFLQQKPINDNNQRNIDYLIDNLSMLVTEVKNPFNSDKNLYIFGERINVQSPDIEAFIDSNRLTGCGGIRLGPMCVLKIGESYLSNNELGVYIINNGGRYNGLSQYDEIYFIDENTIVIEQERNEVDEVYNPILNNYKHTIDINSLEFRFESDYSDETSTGVLKKKNEYLNPEEEK